jgi:hypothetical protein
MARLDLPAPVSTPPTSAGWDGASAVALAVVAVVVFLTFPDYGITWDEPRHQRYGELILEYYRSFGSDRSYLDYFDLRTYGPAFDLLVAALQQVSPLPAYATRHLVTAVVGLLGLVGAWRLARTLAGPRAGFLALVLLAAAPDWYGHLFANPKDLPFASAFVWALYGLVRAVRGLPRPAAGTLFLLGLAAGVAMAIRVAGGVLFAYAGVLLAAWALARTREAGGGQAARDTLRGGLALALAGMLAWTTMVGLWPWAQGHALSHPLTALLTFSDFPFHSRLLYLGQIVGSDDLPWHYLPVTLAVRLPEPVLVGLVLAPLFVWRPGGWDRRTALGWGAVALAGLVPVVHVLVARPTLYDGIRHLLFIVPPLTVIAAGALDRAWSGLAWLPARAALGLALAGWLVTQSVTFVRVHPYQYIVYNGLAGGVAGAARNFDLDYWGSSVRETTEALVREVVAREGAGVTGRPLRVEVCGPVDSVRPYLPEAWEAVDSRDGSTAELFVATPKIPCEATRTGEVLARTERDGVVLSIGGRRRSAR